MLVRFHDWPERLAAFLESRRRAPFEWGVNDCGIFVADGVLAMTGLDIAAEVRSCPHSGFRNLRHMAGRIADAYWIPRVSVYRASRGDVALDRFQRLLLVDLNGDFVGPGDQGLERVPASLIRRAWKI